MAVVPEKVNEAFHEIAGHEYDGEVIIEMILLIARLVQWIQEREGQGKKVENLDDMMSNDPQDRSVYSGSEVSKEGMFRARWRQQILPQRVEGGLTAWLEAVHLDMNLRVVSGLRTVLIGLVQGLRGEEDKVGISEDCVNNNNERNQDKEEKEGEGEIQNFPRQEKLIPGKFFSNNL